MQISSVMEEFLNLPTSTVGERVGDGDAGAQVDCVVGAHHVPLM